MNQLFGEQLDRAQVLDDYPRPQMTRPDWLCLNGEWDCAFTRSAAVPQQWPQKILVPFSPESELSGVERALQPDEWLWYRRELPEFSSGGSRVLLHFGAVDQTADVFVGSDQVAAHTGGYTAFSADITSALTHSRTLTVRVRDCSDTSSHARGKQKTRRGGIWYTPQSGIWQTVWLENVPERYIERLVITPRFDESAVDITAVSDGDEPCTVEMGALRAEGRTNVPVRLALPSFEAWTPEHPALYSFTVTTPQDRVGSYFAMRKVAVAKDEKGVPRIFLNGRPYFMNGLLDQGYWSDGLYTAPTDEAMVYDIETMKMLGFNTLRKHIKIEPLRWYYHCDRLGMLVWQDAVNGGGRYRLPVISLPAVTSFRLKDSHYRLFGRADAAGREEYEKELREMVAQLYNAPSIVLWTPFNEGWGQFDAARIAKELRALDPTRLIDHASGWHDQGAGDIQSLHVYFRPYVFRPDARGRAVVLSEFGGYALRCPGHCFNDRDFGYRKFADEAALTSAIRALYSREILPAVRQGLSAAIYTQVSDVEDELNGLLTYDRKKCKVPSGAPLTALPGDRPADFT